MRQKSKRNSLHVKSSTFQITRNFFTDEQKHEIIQEFLDSRLTKREIWKKYTGHEEEHGQLLSWMRKLGYKDEYQKNSSILGAKLIQVKKKNTDKNPTDSFETLQLKKRLVELEKQLNDTEMKAVAFSTMVDIAEKEFNIPIRKKFNTKPSKK